MLSERLNIQECSVKISTLTQIPSTCTKNVYTNENPERHSPSCSQDSNIGKFFRQKYRSPKPFKIMYHIILFFLSSSKASPNPTKYPLWCNLRVDSNLAELFGVKIGEIFCVGSFNRFRIRPGVLGQPVFII